MPAGVNQGKPQSRNSDAAIPVQRDQPRCRFMPQEVSRQSDPEGIRAKVTAAMKKNCRLWRSGKKTMDQWRARSKLCIVKLWPNRSRRPQLRNIHLSQVSRVGRMLRRA